MLFRSVDRWDGTPLADATREGHTAVADLLVSHGGKLGWDAVRSSGELCSLAKKGDIYGLTQVLKAGCDVNAADYDQRTWHARSCACVQPSPHERARARAAR